MTDLPPIPAPVRDRFEIIETIAVDASQALYRARDTMLSREVVLKVPSPALAHAFCDHDIHTRTLAEAKAMAGVQHASIARILDVLDVPGGPVIVLEPTIGDRLADRVSRDGAFEEREVVELGIALAGALDSLHASGCVHRDVSVESILLLPDGRPVLTGFQFTKHRAGSDEEFLQKSSILYAPESEVGPLHPAPEQLRGLGADARTDVFGLGHALFEAATAASPFRSDELTSIVPIGEDVRRAHGLSKPLFRVLARCLAPNALHRHESARALAEALAAVGSEEPATPAGARGPRIRAPLAAGSALLLAALIGGWMLWPKGSDEAPGRAGERGLDRLRASAASELVAGYDNSYALLIGIGAIYSESELPPLENAEGDVRALAARLESMEGEDWEVTTLLGEQATRRGILDAKAELAARSGPNDRLLVYYAGHGVPSSASENIAYIVPARAEPEDSDPGRSTWIDFHEFFKVFEEAGAKHVMIAMDCCYGGRLVGSRGTALEFSDRYLLSKAHVVLSSGRGSERVSDGVSGGHSPFCQAFLDALEGPGPLTSSMLFADIQRSFLATGASQEPRMGYPRGAPLDGEFVFFLE